MAGSVQAIRIVEDDDVPTDWSRATVQELIDDGSLASVQDGNHGGNYPKPDEFADTGVPLITGADIESGIVNIRTCKFLKPESAAKLRIGFAKTGDVLLSHKGTMGKTAIVPRLSTPYIILNPQLTLYRVTEEGALDRQYLKYFFDSPLFQSFLTRISGISTISTLSLSVQKSLEICFPSKPQQRAIAHILGTLDDKIELNRRMNETLEAMARALFKSWFVDFDPVRAKSEGKDPGLPKPLADLFPDSFEDSELGEIPKGWRVGKLGDVLCQRVERCAPSAETAARPYVPIDCISSKSLFLGESRPGEEAQSSLTKFYKGDLLFGAMRPYFHKVCIAPFDGTTRTTAFVLYPRQPDEFGYATLLLHHPDTIDFATRHSTGSTIPYAVWTGSLEDMPVALPPPNVREAFNGVVQPFLRRIPEPYYENRALTALRDSLLPGLISGEIRLEGSYA